MFAVPPIIAEIAPAIVGMLLAVGGWFAAKRARDIGRQGRP